MNQITNDNNLMRKLMQEKMQYKQLAEKQSDLLKESIALCEKLKNENKHLKNTLNIAISRLAEIAEKMEKQNDIDFPNTAKEGGKAGQADNCPDYSDY